MDNLTRAQQAARILGELAEFMHVEVPVTQSTAISTAAGGQGAPTSDTTTSSTTNASTSSTATSILSTAREAQRLFAPYPAPRGSGFRLAGRSAARAALPRRETSAIARLVPASTPNRQWAPRFCCLAGPADDGAPNPTRLFALKQNGLGEEVIVIGLQDTPAEVENAIRRTFPKLQGHDFEILRAWGGGYGKPISRVSTNHPIPGALILRGYRGVYYVRPVEALTMESLPDPSNGQTTLTFSSDRRGRSSASQASGSNEVCVDEDEIISIPEENTTQEFVEPLSLDELKGQIYEQNPGIQFIHICRDRFLERIIGVYKTPGFDFKKKPRVEFIGEPGEDVGALSKEYFWNGLVALCNEKYDFKPLFEGEADHRLPSCDAMLLRSGVFKMVGRFMAHSALHTGIAFIGLSEAAAEYLITDPVDSDSPLPLSIDDIADAEIRTAIALVKTVKEGAFLSEADMSLVQRTAEASDFNDQVTTANAQILIDHLLYHNVIEKRTRQLEAIKEGFKSAGIFNFLSNKKYLLSGVFPRMSTFEYPPSLLIDNLRGSTSHELENYVKEYIMELSARPGFLKKLLLAWTGWSIIPEGGLRISVEDDTDFIARTCFNEIVIPSNFTRADLFHYMDLLVNDATSGFGSL